MSDNLKKIRTDLNDGTGNYIQEIYTDGKLDYRIIFNSNDQPLEEIWYGEPMLKNTYVYDDQGLEIEFNQYNIHENGYKEFLLQSFTKYDDHGRAIEVEHEDVVEGYRHLFFTYSEEDGQPVQHVFDENLNPIPYDEFTMQRWALKKDDYESELIPELSENIRFDEAVQRIKAIFKQPENDNLIEINTPTGACQVSVDVWDEELLVVTYVFYDECDMNSMPTYILETEDGGLYSLKYLCKKEMDEMFSQMKDVMKLNDNSMVEYVVWH
jgi:hypothetical protein